MDTFIIVMGWLSATAVAIAITAVVCMLMLAQLHNLVDKLKERGASELRASIHRDLQSGAYWFSEHPPTYALLREYAKRIVDGGERNTDAIRDDWRKWMKDFHK